MVVATAAEPDAVETRTHAPSPTVERNAHRPPAPIPLRDVARVFGHAKAVFEADRATPRIGRPGLAPRFEWDAVWAARLEHERARPWTNLVQGRWRDPLSRSRPPTSAMFGSGRHRSGPAGPRISLGLPAAAEPPVETLRASERARALALDRTVVGGRNLPQRSLSEDGDPALRDAESRHPRRSLGAHRS